MAKYTLTYFDIPGRAATTRYMFALAGVDFVDKRIGGPAWAELKPTLPLQQLPVLDVEGHGTITQSGVIERFVAKEVNMFGSNDVETVAIDQLHTTIGEAMALAIPLIFGELSKAEPEKKEEARVALIDKQFAPIYLPFLNRKLEANGGGDGYFVGSKPTLADIRWAYSVSHLKKLDSDEKLQKGFPKLFAVADRVMALPQIQAFVENEGKK